MCYINKIHCEVKDCKYNIDERCDNPDSIYVHYPSGINDVIEMYCGFRKVREKDVEMTKITIDVPASRDDCEGCGYKEQYSNRRPGDYRCTIFKEWLVKKSSDWKTGYLFYRCKKCLNATKPNER